VFGIAGGGRAEKFHAQQVQPVVLDVQRQVPATWPSGRPVQCAGGGGGEVGGAGLGVGAAAAQLERERAFRPVRDAQQSHGQHDGQLLAHPCHVLNQRNPVGRHR